MTGEEIKGDKYRTAYSYVKDGNIYTWHELANLYLELAKIEEKKGPWLQRVSIQSYAFQCGFDAGMKVGIDLMKINPTIKITKTNENE